MTVMSEAQGENVRVYRHVSERWWGITLPPHSTKEQKEVLEEEEEEGGGGTRGEGRGEDRAGGARGGGEFYRQCCALGVVQQYNRCTLSLNPPSVQACAYVNVCARARVSCVRDVCMCAQTCERECANACGLLAGHDDTRRIFGSLERPWETFQLQPLPSWTPEET
jgi:hypothetical protein